MPLMAAKGGFGTYSTHGVTMLRYFPFNSHSLGLGGPGIHGFPFTREFPTPL